MAGRLEMRGRLARIEKSGLFFRSRNMMKWCFSHKEKLEVRRVQGPEKRFAQEKEPLIAHTIVALMFTREQVHDTALKRTGPQNELWEQDLSHHSRHCTCTMR